MSALAHQVEDSKGAWPTAPARERSAEWLGQMIGYLAGPGKSAGPAAAIDRLQEEVEKLLTGDRKAAYELGLAGIAARYDELQALAARPPEEIEAEVNLKKKAIRAALVAAENEVQRIRDEIADIKGPLDKRIATSNREVRMNAPKVGRLRRSIEDQTALVDDLSQPRKYQRVTTSRSTTTRGTSRTTTYIGTRNETTQEKKAREEELATAKAALVEMQADLEKMSQGLDESKNDRDDAKAEIKEATADLWRKLTAAQKQLKEATARARTADQTLLTPASLKLRMTALETYLQYDPGVEKERLLASLKAPTTK